MSLALFFHGYGQNGMFFQQERRMCKVASLFEKQGYDTIFINGFAQCPSINNGCKHPCTWMTNCNSIDDKIDTLLKNVNDHNLYLIGFSEGSVFIDMLLRYYKKHNTKYKINIQGVVFCAGHVNNSIHTEIPSIPSLHIWGTKDTMVVPHLSKKLYKKYKKKHTHTYCYIHNKAHLFPLSDEALSILYDFIKKSSELFF